MPLDFPWFALIYLDSHSGQGGNSGAISRTQLEFIFLLNDLPRNGSEYLGLVRIASDFCFGFLVDLTLTTDTKLFLLPMRVLL